MSLTTKQINFCKHYAINRNLEQSALKAGYSKSYSRKSAYKILENKEVVEYIKKIEDEYLPQEIKDLSFIGISKLKTIINDDSNRATQLKAIILVLQMNGIINKDNEYNSRLNEDDVIVPLIPDEYKQYFEDE
jgi:phage terminase small subunit